MGNKINPYQTVGKMAILIDGGFFLKRLNFLNNFEHRFDVDHIARMIQTLCIRHSQKMAQPIYRIFFYDCPPLENGVHNPLTNRFVKFDNSELYEFKIALFEKLRSMRKMALRLGQISLDNSSPWQIKPQKVKELLSQRITVNDLDPEKDILPNIRQKQVDMKIGIDIATMVLKQQVATIVLVAGDGDFVPAAKMARREGVDFILDPMLAPINPDLNEHVDGMTSALSKKKITTP